MFLMPQSFLFHIIFIYRVIIKQGEKVNANYTAISLFGASMEFILTTTCGHLIIFTLNTSLYLGHLIWPVIILLFFVSLGDGGVWEKIEIFALKLGFEAIFDFKLIRFTKYAPYNLLTMIYPSMKQNWYLKESSWMLDKPLVGLLVKLFCQSSLNMAKTNFFSNKVQLSLKHI